MHTKVVDPSPVQPPRDAEALATLTEDSVALSHGRLRVCRWGPNQGPLLLLVHGLQSHAGLWARIGYRLGAMGVRVVALDRRGHGHSDWFPTYNVLDYVADLGELVDALGAAEVSLVGHCESTVLCSLFAGIFPERVSSLVLLQFPDIARSLDVQTKADLVRLFLKRGAEGSGTHPVFAGASEACDRLLKDAPFKVPEEMARVVTPRNVCPTEGGVTWRWDPAVLRHRLLFDLFEIEMIGKLMSGISARTTFVYGESSSLMAKRKDHLFRLCKRLVPAADMRLVAGGHYPHMEPSIAPELLELLARPA